MSSSTGHGRVRTVDAPDPVLPGADGAVVAVACHRHLRVGSALLRRGHPGRRRPSPSATSSSAPWPRSGPTCRRFRPGDRVLTASVAGCGHCDGCATGDPVTCVEGPKVFGAGELGGGQATAVAVPSADFQLLAIPEGMDDEAALLLTDNLDTGWIGAKRADIPPGRHRGRARPRCRRAVRSALGAGPGRRTCARRRPGGRPPRAGRRLRGASRSRDRRWRPCSRRTGGRGADAVIDAVALDATLDDALASVRAGRHGLGHRRPRPRALPACRC